MSRCAALGEPMPHTREMVLLHGSGGDLATTEYSIVLARDDGGTWRGTTVGRSRAWIDDAPFTPMQRREWTLTAERGQRLDAILRDRCFHAEPTSFASPVPPYVGELAIQLDVVTPTRTRHAEFMRDDARGLTAEVRQIATPN